MTWTYRLVATAESTDDLALALARSLMDLGGMRSTTGNMERAAETTMYRYLITRTFDDQQEKGK